MLKQRVGNVRNDILPPSSVLKEVHRMFLRRLLSTYHIKRHNNKICRSQWPRGLRCRSKAARLLRSWVRIPPRAWMFVCCECCVLSGRDLCDGLIIRSGESYRLWRVVVCDHETSQARRLKPARGLQNTIPDGGCNARRGKKTRFGIKWLKW